ncbi:MAG: prepilin-type N-terminal cleavage/methylation domain-containing protein [Patescibacteria group bacterium]|nr:prepilin-type N-terminal cleavage/methylation domain-containing protein [Patescibacteria group bacterium]
MNKKKGMTLAEMLISISIISIVALVLSLLIISSYSIVRIQRSYLNLQQESTSALKNISNSLNLSSEIVNYPQSTPTYYSNKNTLALKINAIDEANTPLESTYDYFIYYLEDNQLKLKIDADPLSTGREDKVKVISTFVDNVIFRYNEVDPVNANYVSITLIASDTIGNQKKETIFQTSSYLRN